MKILTTTSTKFTAVQLYSGTNSVASYSTESFDTYEEAVLYWEREYKNRNKGDEYDAYWNAKPCVILNETTTRTIIIPE
jgi:hypothetical protein